MKQAMGSLVWGGQEILNLKYAGSRFPIGNGGSISTGLLYATIGVATGVGPAIVQSCTTVCTRASHTNYSSLSYAVLPDTQEGNEKAILIGFALLFVGSLMLAFTQNIWMLLVANLIRPSGSGSM